MDDLDRPAFKIQAGYVGLVCLDFYKIGFKAHKEIPAGEKDAHSNYYKLRKGEEIRLIDLNCLIVGIEDCWVEIIRGREKRFKNVREIHCLNEERIVNYAG